MTTKVPTTIFTGFLGSGKTTIISHLIETLQTQGQQVVYIKNEIGDADIDTQLLRGKGIVSRELLNGCICCTLVGPFLSAITEVVETFHPDRIIIEASGTADPAALALMVSSHPLLTRDGVISVIDVVNFEGYQDLTTTAQAQTTFTDLILFNKVELVDQARKEAVVGYVRELNTHSPILEAPHGHINPEVVFGLSSRELDHLLTSQETHQTSPADHAHHHDHLSADGLTACQVTSHHPQNLAAVTAWLENLPKQVFRAKGFVQADNQTWLVNKVGSRVDVTSLPIKSQTPTKLIFIGYQVDQLQHQLNQEFQRLGTQLKPTDSLSTSAVPLT